MLSLVSVFITTIVLDGSRQLLRNLLYVTVPLITMATASIPALLKYHTAIEYFYVDTLLSGFIFIIGVVASVYCMYKALELQITRKRIFLVFVFPTIIAVLGVNVLDAIVNKEYQMLAQASLGQYLVRIVVYPLLVDVLLAIIETNIQKIPSNQNVNSPNHVVYFFQVAFLFVGRYMTTMAGSVIDIFIMAATVAVRDILLHRMSRIRCRIAYFLRSVHEKIFKRCTDYSVKYDAFEDWFYSKDFTYFKAKTLNNNFVIELVGKCHVYSCFYRVSVKRD